MRSTKKLLLRCLPRDRTKINEPLGLHTYIKLGGPADIFTVAKNVDELTSAVTAAEEAGVPWFILGGGSNILVGDLGMRGLVIKNEAEGIWVSRRLSRWRKFARSPSPSLTLGQAPRWRSGWPQTAAPSDGAAAVSLANLPTSTANSSRNSSGHSYLIAESGVKMAKLAAFANRHGLGGLEVFMSVPGTLGGAIFNNSHYRPRKNEFIGNLVEEAEILESRVKSQESSGGLDRRRIVDRNWFKFGYDYSRLRDEPGVVLRVKFRLQKEPPEALREKSLALMKQRNQHQPIGSPSCGCMFKNPDGVSAGKLIDEAGLKGAKVGGMNVSGTHANFMVNDGSGKVSDVLELMALVKKGVKEFHGIELEPEIFFVGEFSHG